MCPKENVFVETEEDFQKNNLSYCVRARLRMVIY